MNKGISLKHFIDEYYTIVFDESHLDNEWNIFSEKYKKTGKYSSLKNEFEAYLYFIIDTMLRMNASTSDYEYIQRKLESKLEEKFSKTVALEKMDFFA